MPDEDMEARALLMQPLLRAVATHMHAEGLAALRAEVAALRDAARRRRTTQGEAMAQACETALVELSPAMAHRSGDDGG